MQIGDIRALTPAVENCAYFQTSGFSPKPEPVIEEVVKWTQFQNQGPALGWVNREIERMVEGVRTRLAGTLGADEDEIMLNENATVGINIVANGIDWRAGDNIVLSRHEHPGNRLVWYQVSRHFDVELRFAPVCNDGGALLENFEALLDNRTRVVSISHVSRESGLRLPAKALVEIAHRHGVPILFDGAQAFGAVPVNVHELNCDFYTCSGHKYIMAPQATGAFYVRRDMLEWLRPSWIGSHSQEDFGPTGEFRLKNAAQRFEFGTRNIAGYAGMGKALEIWERIGWQKVYGQIADFTDYVKRLLLAEVPGLWLETPLPYSESSGIVTFGLPRHDPVDLSNSLMEKEQVLVAPADARTVRVSTHVFNTEEEAGRLVGGLKRILKTGY